MTNVMLGFSQTVNPSAEKRKHSRVMEKASKSLTHFAMVSAGRTTVLRLRTFKAANHNGSMGGLQASHNHCEIPGRIIGV